MDVYGLSSPDFFRIDDLLDLSNDDLFSSSATASSSSFPVDGQFNSHCPSSCSSSSAASFAPTSFIADFPHDFCVPSDDAAQLEWLSQFVDDSFRDLPANPFEGAMTVRPDVASFPGRARSKRSKATGTTAQGSSRGWISTTETEAPKPRMKKEAGGHPHAPAVGEDTGVRRCTHCASEKTPQWRTGPLGPKTLCNACGVRYKSGRLVPEYRPAASPTFVLTQHSNSHRKVMELRRQNEMMRQQQARQPQPQPYQPQ